MNESQRQHILVFITAYLPLQGGAELAVHHITSKMPDKRFTILTARFTGDYPATEMKGNVTIHRLGFGTRFDKFLLPIFAFIEGLKQIHKDPSIIIWNVMISYGSIAVYFLKIFFKNIALIVTLQEGDDAAHLRKLRLLWKLVLGKASEVQAISHFLADQATSYGFKSEVHVIPNGVDFDHFNRQISKDAIDNLRSKHGLMGNDICAISVSRLVKKNGLYELISALKEITEMKLLLVGDGPERNALIDHAETLGLVDRVVFTGNITNDEIPKYLKSSYFFIRPSRSEGLGIAFLEAMAAGLPIIATPVGGIRDFLVDGRTGLFVELKNPKSIAEGMQTMLDDRTLYEKLRENGERLIKEEYTWEKVVRSMDHMFKEVAK